MGTRFLLYGLAGWTMEIVFTGIGSLLTGSISLTAKTYLWMFPIYGLAFFLEPVHDQIRSSPWFARGFIWAALILCIEYLTGWLLRTFIGLCPWDYSGQSRFVIDGLIRIDYLPFWFAGGLLFEKLHDLLDNLLMRLD